ncbi:MAG: DUF3943 domain-containing protein [Bacteroidota bacterium]|jgi:hypothetical protein
MKTLCILVISVMCSALLQAQYLAKPDKHSTSSLNDGEEQHLYRLDSEYHSSLDSNLENHSLQDTAYDRHGDLQNDDAAFNQRQPLWRPLLGIVGSNIVTNLTDTYILKNTFTHVGFVSWGRNLKAGWPWGSGWEWDQDRFGMNFFMHPYGGGIFFNSARTNGYNFWASIPYTFLGSYMWKIFGETGVPERNDLIATTVNGVFFGEIFYRVGSDLLDDQATGAERFFRETAVAILSPTRFLSRLSHGQLTRLAPKEVYQKEPLDITLTAGYHRINEGTSLQSGSNSVNLGLVLDYGNPFEVISRKPYDYFRVRADLDFGVGRKIVDAVTGYGILCGSNYQTGNLEMLAGLSQHMSYFDNWTFELGTMAFGPSIISKLPMSESSCLYTDLHLGLVPFGGLSRRFGPDTTLVRDYDYVGGTEAKLENTVNIGKWADFTIVGYYWWLHTYVGVAGNSYIALVKPSIVFKIFNTAGIGFEHQIYYSDRYPKDFASVHSVRTEEKVYLILYFETFKHEKE